MQILDTHNNNNEDIFILSSNPILRKIDNNTPIDEDSIQLKVVNVIIYGFTNFFLE